MAERKRRTVEHRIRDAIVRLRPLLHLGEPGDVDLVSFDAHSGVVILRLDGGCPDCDMPVAALMQGIEAHLKLRVPEIREVQAVGGTGGRVRSGKGGAHH
jgi:Fe-S cluster biogenesis protein NfuA